MSEARYLDLTNEIESEQSKGPTKNKYLYEKKKAKREKKKIKIEKEIQSIKIPKSVMKIINHWNNCPVRKLKQNSKLFEETITVLKQVRMGRYFKPYMFTDAGLAKKYIGKKIRPDDFIRSINNFVLMTDDPLYIKSLGESKWYRGRSLKDFVYGEYFKLDKRGKWKEDPEKESLLLKWLEKKPYAHSVPALEIPDNHPQLSLRLKNLYVKNVLGGLDIQLSERDLNCFKIGADKLHVFYAQYENRMQYLMGGETELADLLYKALEKANPDKLKLYPAKFCSHFTFSNLFPLYLNNEGILKNEKMNISPD